MHRKTLLDMLEIYAATFPGEEDVVERVANLVRGHADCFDRSCRPGHITASAWILSADRRKCLMTHHRKLGKWLQLGGHADGESDPLDTALREAREESSISAFEVVRIAGCLLPLDIDVHEIPPRIDSAGHICEDAHEHHDVRFLLVTGTDQLARASDESDAVAWFTADEVRMHTQESSILRMLRKASAWMA